MPLTDILTRRHLYLQAIPGTPLGELVKATAHPAIVGLKNTGADDNPVKLMACVTNQADSMATVSPHCRVMADLTDVAVRAVQSHILHAKTIVRPAVEELVMKVTEAMENLTPSVLLGMEIIVHSPSKPLLNPGLETLVRKFEETPFDDPDLAMRLPAITANEIKELLATGSGNLDSDIKEWLAVKGDAFVQNVWDKIFMGEFSRDMSFSGFVNDSDCGADHALLIFLLARKLDNDPLPETDMNLDKFNRLIIEYRNQAAAKLCRELNKIDEANRLGILVRSNTRNQVTVNKSVYDKWLKDGGENEILFGNLLNRPVATTVGTINDGAEEMKDAWNQHSLITATAENNRRFSRTKELLYTAFEEQVREIPAVEVATLGNRMECLQRFEKLLDTVKESEINDLWSLSLRLVCGARFYRSDAEKILGGMEEQRKLNPLMPVRELATVSIYNYISDWVSRQFRIKSF